MHSTRSQLNVHKRTGTPKHTGSHAGNSGHQPDPIDSKPYDPRFRIPAHSEVQYLDAANSHSSSHSGLPQPYGGVQMYHVPAGGD
jgi:hypothetical protein